MTLPLTVYPWGKHVDLRNFLGAVFVYDRNGGCNNTKAIREDQRGLLGSILFLVFWAQKPEIGTFISPWCLVADVYQIYV